MEHSVKAKLKAKKCAVFVWVKRKRGKEETCHLICLTKEQQKSVLDHLQIVHGGAIQVFDKEYSLQYLEEKV